MKDLVWAIRYPILVAVANGLVGNYLWSSFAFGAWVAIAFRLCLIGWAGWLLARNMESGLLEAIIVSAYVPLIDPVLVTCGKLLILYFFGWEQALALNPELAGEQSDLLGTFLAVGVAYFLFLPVFLLSGAIGWVLGRRPS